MKLLGVMFAAILMSMLSSLAYAQKTCENLSSLSLPDTTITMAQTVAAGAFAPPEPFPVGSFGAFRFVAAKDLPEFCRVAAIAKPTKDSEIKFEVWMPSASNWNGKFMAVGNGGLSGAVEYLLMDAALSRGYATASTNTGHDGGVGDARFALGHPEKVVDFGYRAVHEMTLKAKLAVTAYYGVAPKFSYWHGCSTGGRQGLMEAQRFPADYDGIMAGAPANFLTHLTAQAVWTKQAIQKNPAALVPPSKLAVLHNAVLEACDARDGVKDGVLEDPRRCDFDPKILECKGDDRPSCLTPAQVQLVLKFYGAVINPRTKEQIFPGYALGSELGWGEPGGVGRMLPESVFGKGQYFGYVLFQDANWDYRTFDFDSGMARADRLDGGVANAINPDLRIFFRRGGKLLQYHGWSDPGISPFNSVDYYNSVLKFMGGIDKIEGSYRLFMVPGMEHCADGEGPNTFDAIGAIEQWVEQGKAPERVIASHLTDDGKINRTRPLCPYPQVAKYKGTGSTDDVANFSCSVSSPQSLILQASDGEHRVGRPRPDDRASFPFIIKVDGQNGNAQDFFVLTEIMVPGDAIPFHMHHNAEEVLILEEGGATVTVGDKRAVAGPHSIVFIPRETWVSATNTGTQPIHLYALFSRQGFDRYFRPASVLEGQPVTPLAGEELTRLRALGHATYWDTSKGPYPPGVAQSAPQTGTEIAKSPASPYPLILQEGDGEHLLRRPRGQTPAAGPGSIPEFIIKIDKQNGAAEDFVALTEDLKPGAFINFHKHHNAEEVLILEEGGATVTVGDKRALTGPHALVFIPRETWVSVTNTANHPIHLYALFSRPGFEEYLRARSVHPGEPLTPMTLEELRQAAEHGHCTFWDVSKGPYPPGVPHP